MTVNHFSAAIMLAIAMAAAPIDEPAAAAAPIRTVYVMQDAVMTGFDGGSTQGTIHATLKTKAGDTAGTLDAFIVATLVPQDAPFTAVLMITATLAGGQVTAQGAAQLGDQQEPFDLAVTGGTAAFKGAAGFLRVKPINGTGTGPIATVVFELQP